METLKQGATDYVVKQRLQRLPMAIARALREARDAAERRHLEQALRTSEARFRGAFESRAMGMALFDARQDHALAVNDRLLEITGGTREEFEHGAWHWRNTTPPEWVAVSRNAVAQVRSKGFWDPYEKEFLHRDGTRVRARLSCAPLPDEPGCVVVTVEDITARHHAEAALSDSRACLAAEQMLLAALVEHLPVGVNVLDRSGTTVLSNPAFRAYLPDAVIPSRQADGEQHWIASDTQGQRLTRDQFPAARALRGETVPGAEFLYRRADGSETWTRISAVPLQNPAGQLTGAISVIVDIDAQKQAQQALRHLNETLEERVAAELAERMKVEAVLNQAQKMDAIGQLTGGMAHDFNNLLQAVQSALQLITWRTGQVEGLGDVLDAARQAVERGSGLVRQLMAFARHQNLNPEALDIRDLFLAIRELLARVLRADIHLEFAPEPASWPALADPIQLELALLNLVINARDALPAGGNIQVGGCNAVLDGTGPERLSGDFLRIWVKDNGTGMPPDVASRAFDPFFTTKQPGQGTGLGLAQVYGFCRQSGGWAEITTEPGQGTSVSLLLPRATSAAVATSIAEQTTVRGRGAHMLLVEDDPIVGSMVAAALKELGYQAAHASSGDEALRRLQGGEAVDLLFTDIVLPGAVSGVSLARMARRLRPGLPILLTTGYSEDVSGAQDFQVLAKPCRIEALADALAQLVR